MDQSPCFAEGLISALRTRGLVARECRDPLRWARLAEEPVLLMAADDADQQSLIERLHDDQPRSVSVAVVSELDLDNCSKALRAGAASVVARTSTPDEIVAVLRSALAGATLLPVHLVREFATQRPAAKPPRLPEREVEWIRSLAKGATVRSLADAAGYSERHMFRQLERVYRVMGVRTRHEAVLELARRDATALVTVEPSSDEA